MHPIEIAPPPWLDAFLSGRPARYPGDTERMALTVELARANIAAGSGGPFGAAVFARGSGELLAAGINLVTSTHCSIAHAEMVAMATAQQSLGHHDLAAAVAGGCELFTSAEPCAMCLGAIPWAGVARVVCGARDADVRAIGFDEGHKPADWPQALAARGIAVTRDLMRAEAAAVLRAYVAAGGAVYGPQDPAAAAAPREPGGER